MNLALSTFSPLISINNFVRQYTQAMQHMVEACLEEDFWLGAVEVMLQFLSSDRYPPSRFIRITMTQLVQVLKLT